MLKAKLCRVLLYQTRQLHLPPGETKMSFTSKYAHDVWECIDVLMLYASIWFVVSNVDHYVIIHAHDIIASN